MILNLSDENFIEIMRNKNLHLPLRWSGTCFDVALSKLFDEYTHELFKYEEDEDNGYNVGYNRVESVCNGLKSAIREYHNGYPSRAFIKLKGVMNVLVKYPLREYQKSGEYQPLHSDTLKLYRVRNVSQNKDYDRKDIFHTPIGARPNISTCRYSIAGYPSLYLATSLDLCVEETPPSTLKIVARYEFIRNQPELNIRAIELGIKPQDFTEASNIFSEYNSNRRARRDLSEINLRDRKIRSAYLLWYPLIAACSFIRADKTSAFSSEYIIPQLLMQWVRLQSKRSELLGIRYFSCASIKASELGFDYVFPVSNTNFDNNFCSILRDMFLITQPIFLHENFSIDECEWKLDSGIQLDKI